MGGAGLYTVAWQRGWGHGMDGADTWAERNTSEEQRIGRAGLARKRGIVKNGHRRGHERCQRFQSVAEYQSDGDHILEAIPSPRVSAGRRYQEAEDGSSI